MACVFSLKSSRHYLRRRKTSFQSHLGGLCLLATYNLLCVPSPILFLSPARDKTLLQGLLEATRDVNKQLEARSREQTAKIEQHSQEICELQQREKEHKASYAALEQALEHAEEKSRQLEVDVARQRVERAAESGGQSSRAEVSYLFDPN